MPSRFLDADVQIQNADQNVGRLTCGIAMCTCNAGPYLTAQLRSLVTQTRMPSQIVISDDSSDDGTWQVLEQWATEARIRHNLDVRLIRNRFRLGVRKNFEQAIRALATDIVFLADQDDIWADNKIEQITARFESAQDLLLVHTDAKLINEEGKDLGLSLFTALGLSMRERKLMGQGRWFELYCRRNLVTGTTAAFRVKPLIWAFPIPDDWIHDEWLAFCAAARGNIAMLSEQLTQYRQHRSNAIGMPINFGERLRHYASRVARMSHGEYLAYKWRRLEALRVRLTEFGGVSADKLTLLTAASAHFERRLIFSKGLCRRIPAVFCELTRCGYHRFGDGFLGALRDLLKI